MTPLTMTSAGAKESSEASRDYRSFKILGLRVVLLCAFLLVWELAAGRLVQEFFISRPSAIIAVFIKWMLDGSLFYHAAITATEAFLGYVIGGLLGMAFGVFLGRTQLLAEVLDPFIMAFYSLPKVALAPLFILWLGLGLEMKVTLVSVIVFFLVFLNTYTGVREVSRELIAILNLMGAKERHLLLKVVIPSAVTWVFTGLRISAPYALIGAIVAELMAANRGLGYLLVMNQSQFNTAGVFASLIAIMLLAMALNIAVKITEKAVMPWKNVEADKEITI